MRFHNYFQRYFGGTPPTGSTLLNADSAPTMPPNGADNLLSSRAQTFSGWVGQRLVAGYKYVGGGAAPDISADVYYWEEQAAAWFKVSGTPLTMKNGIFSFVQCVLPIEGSATKANLLGNNASMSSVEAVLVPSAVLPPDGEYRFVMTLDLAGY